MKKYTIIFLILHMLLISNSFGKDFHSNKNNTSFIYQNHLKNLLENEWVVDKIIIHIGKEKKNIYDSTNDKDSLSLNKSFIFTDSTIVSDSKIVGLVKIDYINHIDTIKTYEKEQVNIDKYRISCCFLGIKPFFSGGFKISRISDLYLNIQKRTVNKIANKEEIIDIFFHAKGKENEIKNLKKNSNSIDKLYYQ